MAWLRNYAMNFGEKIPNTIQIHLPPCSTKTHVYETMVLESQMEFEEPLSLSHFLRLWREEALHIAIPKTILFFSLERQKYYKHQAKAISHPEKDMSLIIDGMDQSKTQKPHFVHASKYTASVWKLRVYLVGVIVHGIVSMAFFDLFEYSHSTNHFSFSEYVR